MARKPQKAPKTSPEVKHLGGEGLTKPDKLTKKQVQKLAGSVERHIPRKPKPKK